MAQMKRFLLRWKYTLSAIFGIIVPSVIMLFFQPTRMIAIVVLVVFWIAFISEGLKML